MRNLALVCCTFVLLAVAAPAFAQADTQITNPDPCQGSMNIDTCMWSDNPVNTTGSQYQNCTALKSQGMGCQWLQTTQFIGTECVTVYRSAFCYCKSETNTATGQCTYYGS
jgi:hypothetical protein